MRGSDLAADAAATRGEERGARAHVLPATRVRRSQGNTTRRIGELTGHTASVTHIALDERLNHVFTLAADKVIKVRIE